jgi:hypothetical protein
MLTLVQQLDSIITERYPNFQELAGSERVLLTMSILANDIKVREKTGHNDGADVKEILATVHLPEGYSWCASSLEFACQYAHYKTGPVVYLAAAVHNWVEWAKQNGKLTSVPGRGKLCYRFDANNVNGHIGICAEVKPNGNIRDYEGNTSSGISGSQRDGDGLYQRTRVVGFWQGFITI